MTDPLPRDQPGPWPVVASADLHRDDWVIAFRVDTVHPPGDDPGTAFDRLVLEHPGAVVVLAVDDAERVLCVRQYRHALGGRMVELPAGLCDTVGEDPLEVGRRELAEEAQLAARDWTHLLSVHPSPGVSDELVHLYLARGLTPVDRGDFEPQHEEADMDVFWAPYDRLLEAVLAGVVTEAPIALALLVAQARGLAGRPNE